jgi:hypothetical protein
MIGNLAGPLPILVPLALLSTLPALFVLYRQKLLKAFYLTLGGLSIFCRCTFDDPPRQRS